MQKIVFCIFLVFSSYFLSARMVVGTDTLYGNEWIDYSQSYFKIPVAEDGIYRLNGSDLAAAGIPVSTVNANQYRLFYLGQELPIYVSTTGNLSNSDYISFVGKKNRTGNCLIIC